ncbi:MAG: DUF5658 family protein [Planctomycetota bacterium]
MARRRPMRIAVLLVAATILGLADLALTLTYLTSIGMFEGNPIARLVIASGSAWTVAAFKVLTIALTVWITVIMRRRWQAEMLAWVSAVVMLGLFLHWLGYIAYAESSTGTLAVVALDPSHAAGSWVSLP